MRLKSLVRREICVCPVCACGCVGKISNIPKFPVKWEMENTKTMITTHTRTHILGQRVLLLLLLYCPGYVGICLHTPNSACVCSVCNLCVTWAVDTSLKSFSRTINISFQLKSAPGRDGKFFAIGYTGLTSSAGFTFAFNLACQAAIYNARHATELPPPAVLGRGFHLGRLPK